MSSNSDSSIPNENEIKQGSAPNATQQANSSTPSGSTAQPVTAACSEGQNAAQGTNSHSSKWQNIPLDLQNLNQWAIAGPDKAPSILIGGVLCKCSPVQGPWMTFAEACGYAAQHNLNIGILLTHSDPYACIDMDIKDRNSIDKRTGLPYPESEWSTSDDLANYTNFISASQTYTELSASGRGVHAWFKAGIGRGRRNARWEAYDRERFIISTGNTIKSIAWQIEEGVISVEGILDGINPIKPSQNMVDNILYEIGATNGHDELDDLVEIEQKLDDEGILKVASNSANGEKFNRLYTGDTTGYPSGSEADHALVEMLCFYSPSNKQVRRLFYASKLGKRDKHHRNNGYHVNLSIQKIRTIQSNEQAKERREVDLFIARIQPAIDKGIAECITKAQAANQPQYIPPSNTFTNHAKLTPKSLGEFMEEQKEIEFLIDDIFQRGGLYAITGQTGSGKTGVGVTTAMRVACGQSWGSHETKQSNVLYIAGENPSDVRMRFKAYVAHYPDTLEQARNAIQVIDESFLLKERTGELLEIIDQLSIGLIVIDTDQAVYGDDDNDNDNQKRLAHAKLARTLTRCPLKPCVLIQCHGSKYGDDLQPRGGSSFINELDGNYCCTFDKNNTATLKPDENKWRGDRSLAEMQFVASYPTYNTDTKGRPITTPLFDAKSNITEVANDQLDKQINEENAEFDEFIFNHIGELVSRGEFPSNNNLSRGSGLKRIQNTWTGAKKATQATVTESINRLKSDGKVKQADKSSSKNAPYLIQTPNKKTEQS